MCKQKKWAEIGRDLGYSGKIMSSLSTSLKNSYGKWLDPYEQYLKVVKPGVHQLLEMENGGPFTPSPAPSPLKKSAQGTPTNAAESPAMRASAALNATLQGENVPTPTPEPARPIASSGFTPVNAGGFTAVNAQPAPPAPMSNSASFSAINGLHFNNVESRNSTPLRNGGSPMLSAHSTPDLRPFAVGPGPLSNGHALNQLKRTMSQETESGVDGEVDAASGRRSKRVKKGKPAPSSNHSRPVVKTGLCSCPPLPRSRHDPLRD